MSVVHPYRIKHKLTGLYYNPRSSSTLNETGKVYFNNNNIISYLGTHYTVDLRISNRRIIEKYRDVLAKCGSLSTYYWVRYNAKGDEFEREDLTLNGIIAAN